MIATGIGVTPFASILQSIMHRYWKARHTCPKCKYTWASEIPPTVMHLRKVSNLYTNRRTIITFTKRSKNELSRESSRQRPRTRENQPIFSPENYGKFVPRDATDYKLTSGGYVVYFRTLLGPYLLLTY